MHPFPLLVSCKTPSINGLFSSLKEQEPATRVCKENSCLSTQQLPAELLSHTFSLHSFSHCSHSVHLPLHLGWVGGEKKEVKQEKKTFMFTQDHYYDTAGSCIRASLQAAREGWRRETSDCKINCLPLFFCKRLASEQMVNLI